MISIFAKRAFLNTNPTQEFISKDESYKGRGHLQRVSSIIRADQIAERIGARLNPTEDYENDVCIYVKPHIKKGDDFNFEGERSYLDIIDGANLGELASRYPEVTVITCSQADYEIMSRSVSNRIVLIPQHHCNFEKFKRESKEVKVLGIIGEQKAENWFPDSLQLELDKRGIELKFFHKFFSRADIVNFYMSIDLQLVWRPYKKILSNPLKIVNAASFGIPTIALDEPAFKEMHDTYYGVNDFNGFLKALDTFIAFPSVYKHYSEKCLGISEWYHIDKIASLYKQL